MNHFIEREIATFGLSRPAIVPILTESYSQCYEDIIIESILRSECLKRNISMNELSYIDIGANHSISTSNTYLFYKKYNMKGILVEANPLLCDELSKFRSEDTTIHAAIVNHDSPKSTFYISDKHEISSLSHDFITKWAKESHTNTGISSSIQVDNIRINKLFELLDQKVGLLSIDVEGLDKEILLDLDTTVYRPIVIVIEPSDFFVSNNTQDIIDIMKERGYNLLSKTDVNLIFAEARPADVN